MEGHLPAPDTDSSPQSTALDVYCSLCFSTQMEYGPVLASLVPPLSKGSMKQARESSTPGAQWLQVQHQTLFFLSCMALGE